MGRGEGIHMGVKNSTNLTVAGIRLLRFLLIYLP